MSRDPWQKLRTAPRDGTKVLMTWAASWPDNPHIEACYWDQDEDEWRYASDGVSPSEGGKPTHWMPLPDPPEPA